MKYNFRIIASLALLTLAPAVDAQPVSEETVKTAVELRELALKSDSAYQFLEDLTTEVGARLAGTEQELLAIDWSVERLTAMGFDKVYKEPFPLTV